MVIAAHFDAHNNGNRADKPRAARRTLRLDTSGSLPSGKVAAVLVHNVSATGMLIETHTALAIGERMTVDWPLAGELGATVVWNSAEMFGCQFDTPLSPAALAAAELRGAPATDPTIDPATDPTAGTARPLIATEPFGARMKRLRKAKGMTLLDIANRLGVSKPTVWAWEQDKARPTDDHFSALAGVLDVAPEELRVGRDGDAADDMLAAIRARIAAAYGIRIDMVRIMIDL